MRGWKCIPVHNIYTVYRTALIDTQWSSYTVYESITQHTHTYCTAHTHCTALIDKQQWVERSVKLETCGSIKIWVLCLLLLLIWCVLLLLLLLCFDISWHSLGMMTNTGTQTMTSYTASNVPAEGGHLMLLLTPSSWSWGWCGDCDHCNCNCDVYMWVM